MVNVDNMLVAGIDAGKYFSEMVILSPDNKVSGRIKLNHCKNDFDKVLELLKKRKRSFK